MVSVGFRGRPRCGSDRVVAITEDRSVARHAPPPSRHRCARSSPERSCRAGRPRADGAFGLPNGASRNFRLRGRAGCRKRSASRSSARTTKSPSVGGDKRPGVTVGQKRVLFDRGKRRKNRGGCLVGTRALFGAGTTGEGRHDASQAGCQPGWPTRRLSAGSGPHDPGAYPWTGREHRQRLHDPPCSSTPSCRTNRVLSPTMAACSSTSYGVAHHRPRDRDPAAKGDRLGPRAASERRASSSAADRWMDPSRRRARRVPDRAAEPAPSRGGRLKIIRNSVCVDWKPLAGTDEETAHPTSASCRSQGEARQRFPWWIRADAVDLR